MRAIVVVSDGKISNTAQKSTDGWKTRLSKKPEGDEETVRFAVAFEMSDVLTKAADPKLSLRRVYDRVSMGSASTDLER